MMRITKIAGALLMSATAGAGLACDLPPLVAIPAKADVADKAPQIQQEMQVYFEAMKVYTACVQAEITAAGGDSAPTLTKAVLVQRNNMAVAEAQGVLKAFTESVGTAPGAAGASPAGTVPQGGAAPQGGKDGGRRRDR